MKKFIPLVVVGLLVLCGLEAVALPFNMAGTSVQKWKQTPYTPLNRADILDQSQPVFNFFGPVGSFYLATGSPNYIIAQSFTPTLNMLTRVELMIAKNITAIYDYTVGIRDDLNGSDLTSASLPASEFSSVNLTWEEFDFPDIVVTPGDTYYIVSSTVNATDNWYFWGAYFNETNDIYPNGTIYYTINDEVNWTEEPDGDMTFKTYGVDATFLNLTITGGIGVTVNTKNVGVLDATNVKTSVTMTGGIFGLINVSEDVEAAILTAGDVLPFKGQPLGLGPITITVTARADNAAEVTKSVDGLILLFFVIVK
jgi:hypothetical protein